MRWEEGREGERECGREGGTKSIPDVDKFGTGEELAEDADAGRVGGGLGMEGGREGERQALLVRHLMKREQNDQRLISSKRPTTNFL